jgi:Domain of unknown function (DUF1844)
MNEAPDKKFKVQDNRRFDSSGNERADEKKIQPVAAAEPVIEVGTSTPSGEDKADPLDFSSFIMSLATQALLQLGVMKAPQGVSVPVDKAAARQTIDLISMLREKTKGNLDAAEDRLMEEILHSLHMSFIKSA